MVWCCFGAGLPVVCVCCCVWGVVSLFVVSSCVVVVLWCVVWLYVVLWMFVECVCVCAVVIGLCVVVVFLNCVERRCVVAVSAFSCCLSVVAFVIVVGMF